MRVVISGCDDTTYIDEEDWGMSFSSEEIEVIAKLADLSEKNSSYQCQPTIRIEGDIEPKHYWVIDDDGVLACRTVGDFANEEMCKLIGNYFETKEEAEKAVEKLKAWKRLKDKGFRFKGYDAAHNSNSDICGQLFYKAGDYNVKNVKKDLDLLFGGEEEE